MGKHLVWALGLCIFIPKNSHAQSYESLIPVRLGHVENFLSPEENSPRFQEGYLAGLSYALGEVDSQLRRCGYRVELYQRFFKANDKLAVVEAGQDLKKLQSWIVYGPRRSDDYLLLKKGLGEDSALVSPMANAFAVTSLPPPFFTMSPTTEQFAKAALETVVQEKFGQSYGAVVEGTCTACKDFENYFYSIAKNKLQRKFRLEIVGNLPNIDHIRAQLKNTPVDFILLPNFARISGYVIAQLQKEFRNLKFVGSDGWGDGDFVLLGNYKVAPDVKGLSFRGGLPREKMAAVYSVNSLTKEYDSKLQLPHYNTLAVVDFMRTLTKTLCTARPKNKDAFLSYLKKQNPAYFQSKIGIGVYKLEKSKLHFVRRHLNSMAR